MYVLSCIEFFIYRFLWWQGFLNFLVYAFQKPVKDLWFQDLISACRVFASSTREYNSESDSSVASSNDPVHNPLPALIFSNDQILSVLSPEDPGENHDNDDNPRYSSFGIAAGDTHSVSSA